MKEKMLMKLERDRIKAKIEAIEAQMKAMQVSFIYNKTNTLLSTAMLVVAPQCGSHWAH